MSTSRERLPIDDIYVPLTHWGRVTHICVSKLTNIGPDNGLSPGRRQAIIWTNDGILLIGPLGTNFSEILIEIYIFSFKKMHLKMSSAKCRPFCLGLNVLNISPMWGAFGHTSYSQPPPHTSPSILKKMDCVLTVLHWSCYYVCSTGSEIAGSHVITNPPMPRPNTKNIFFMHRDSFIKIKRS